jgi:ribosomal-protein-alanine acetyltransferase
MTGVIEKATVSDIVAVKEIELECSLSPWTEADYLSELNRTDSLFYLVMGESSVAGFVLARLIMLKPLTNEFNEIEIYNIAVKPQFRNKAFGSRLLSKILNSAHNQSVGEIHLEVRKSNVGAIEFYKKNSFEINGIRKNFYANPTEDAILLRHLVEPAEFYIT